MSAELQAENRALKETLEQREDFARRHIGPGEAEIRAMKSGAFDYITKPFKNDEVLVVLQNAIERRQLVAENVSLRQNLQARYHKFAGIIGKLTDAQIRAALRASGASPADEACFTQAVRMRISRLQALR